MIEHTDYLKFLQEFALTDSFLRSVSGNTEDFAWFSDFKLDPPVAVGLSDIQGHGLFATTELKKGYTVAARIGNIRTPAGRFVNHSPTPNCRFIPVEDGLCLQTLQEIAAGTELTLDYRQAMSANSVAVSHSYAVVEALLHNKFQQFITKLTGSAVFPTTTREEIRTKICQIELLMEQAVNTGDVINSVDSYPIRSRYAAHMYVREITIPAGHFVIGRLHREDHYNVITKGKVSVLTEEGGLEVFTAPISMISPAGCKRILFTHEDTEWTTTHVTDLTDVDEIEKAVIAPSYTAMGWNDPKVKLLNSAELQRSNTAEKLKKELLCLGVQ